MKKLSNSTDVKNLSSKEQKAIGGGGGVPPWCERFYLADPDGVNCIKSGGIPGVITYYNGRDYCC